MNIIKCIFRTLKQGVSSNDCPNTQSSETQSRKCYTANNRKVVCNTVLDGPAPGFSFEACMGDFFVDDSKCKTIGPDQKVAGKCSYVDGREICVQDCNQEVCRVRCYNPTIDIGGSRPVCAGCKNGKIKMESEGRINKHKIIVNITCEQNGEEIPTNFACEEKCGCVQDEKGA